MGAGAGAGVALGAAAPPALARQASAARPTPIGRLDGLPGNKSISSAGFHSDGRHLLAQTSAGAWYWDVSRPSHPVKAGEMPAGFGSLQQTLPDRPVAASTAPSGLDLLFWNLVDPARPVKLSAYGLPRLPERWGLEFSPDGKRFALVRLSGMAGSQHITLVDTSDPARPTDYGSAWNFSDPNGKVRCMTFVVSPDGARSCLAMDFGSELGDWWMLYTTDPINPGILIDGVPCVDSLGGFAHHIGSGLIAATAWNGHAPYLKLWRWALDPQRGYRLSHLQDLPASEIHAKNRYLAFSPDGRLLAIVCDTTVELFGIQGTGSAARLRHRASLSGAGLAAFSPNSRTLLTQGPTGTGALLWGVSRYAG
ncbi:hypothetical protein BIV57_22210 [Mangrovactinospora gilvigrisea]|uniref:WD40 repeat domain-containing protein n=1 Tax=Mangrovactinospora gilvigrisea TaxID=1428644 RepID=A0A1J7B9I5_9ACTN|nr:WD40 repeat domain-containing protein [Mangrovactinospora gilvigrisea]OIV35315.1 hypothetical protein BIV57_22210 [Mangrovactinospora gilvigrisea]